MENIDVEGKGYNFMYERLVQLLENSAFLPLEKYNSYIIKKCDEKKKLTNEHINKIICILNQFRTYYIDSVNSEIDRFIEKYNLKEKLKIKSEVFMYEMIINELNLTVKELEEIDELNTAEGEEEKLLKFYLSKYSKDRNKELEKENSKLRAELESLRKSNNFNLN